MSACWNAHASKISNDAEGAKEALIYLSGSSVEMTASCTFCLESSAQAWWCKWAIDSKTHRIRILRQPCEQPCERFKVQLRSKGCDMMYFRGLENCNNRTCHHTCESQGSVNPSVFQEAPTNRITWESTLRNFDRNRCWHYGYFLGDRFR